MRFLLAGLNGSALDAFSDVAYVLCKNCIPLGRGASTAESYNPVGLQYTSGVVRQLFELFHFKHSQVADEKTSVRPSFGGRLEQITASEVMFNLMYTLSSALGRKPLCRACRYGSLMLWSWRFS